MRSASCLYNAHNSCEGHAERFCIYHEDIPCNCGLAHLIRNFLSDPVLHADSVLCDFGVAHLEARRNRSNRYDTSLWVETADGARKQIWKTFNKRGELNFGMAYKQATQSGNATGD